MMNLSPSGRHGPPPPRGGGNANSNTAPQAPFFDHNNNGPPPPQAWGWNPYQHHQQQSWGGNNSGGGGGFWSTFFPSFSAHTNNSNYNHPPGYFFPPHHLQHQQPPMMMMMPPQWNPYHYNAQNVHNGNGGYVPPITSNGNNGDGGRGNVYYAHQLPSSTNFVGNQNNNNNNNASSPLVRQCLFSSNSDSPMHDSQAGLSSPLYALNSTNSDPTRSKFEATSTLLSPIASSSSSSVQKTLRNIAGTLYLFAAYFVLIGFNLVFGLGFGRFFSIYDDALSVDHQSALIGVLFVAIALLFVSAKGEVGLIKHCSAVLIILGVAMLILINPSSSLKVSQITKLHQYHSYGSNLHHHHPSSPSSTTTSPRQQQPGDTFSPDNGGLSTSDGAASRGTSFSWTKGHSPSSPPPSSFWSWCWNTVKLFSFQNLQALVFVFGGVYLSYLNGLARIQY